MLGVLSRGGQAAVRRRLAGTALAPGAEALLGAMERRSAGRPAEVCLPRPRVAGARADCVRQSGTAPLLTTSASVDEYIRSNFGEPIRREGDDGSLSPRRKLSEGHTLTPEELEQLKRIASVADHNASL